MGTGISPNAFAVTSVFSRGAELFGIFFWGGGGIFFFFGAGWVCRAGSVVLGGPGAGENQR